MVSLVSCPHNTTKEMEVTVQESKNVRVNGIYVHMCGIEDDNMLFVASLFAGPVFAPILNSYLAYVFIQKLNSIHAIAGHRCGSTSSVLQLSPGASPAAAGAVVSSSPVTKTVSVTTTDSSRGAKQTRGTGAASKDGTGKSSSTVEMKRHSSTLGVVSHGSGSGANTTAPDDEAVNDSSNNKSDNGLPCSSPVLAVDVSDIGAIMSTRRKVARKSNTRHSTLSRLTRGHSRRSRQKGQRARSADMCGMRELMRKLAVLTVVTCVSDVMLSVVGLTLMIWSIDNMLPGTLIACDFAINTVCLCLSWHFNRAWYDRLCGKCQNVVAH